MTMLGVGTGQEILSTELLLSCRTKVCEAWKLIDPSEQEKIRLLNPNSFVGQMASPILLMLSMW